MTQTEQLLLSLIRIGIWKDHVIKSIPKNTDWNTLYTMAQNQGVAAIVLDGINFCYEKGIELNLGFQTKIDWIGLVSQMEVLYTQHEPCGLYVWGMARSAFYRLADPRAAYARAGRYRAG